MSILYVLILVVLVVHQAEGGVHSVADDVPNMICPDHKSICSDGSTCCKSSRGGYGCCPVPNAVCCSDHIHCCPQGYTCDTTAGTCTRGSEVVELLTKISPRKVSDVVCPDETRCQNGETCCKVSPDRYGCCPVPNAVCCSDYKHCCPHGYTCDTTAGTCIRGSEVVELLTKISTRKVPNIICPDGGICEDGETCCKVSPDSYGCCPLPNAVCCSDYKHCCPQGTQCTTSGCLGGSGIMKMFSKISSRKVPNIICPDGGICEDGETCCKVSPDSYGCCPLPNAVCCSDYKHCCPQGTQCTTSGCSGGSGIMKMFSKISSRKVPNIICPDGGICEDGETCCKVSPDSYGCCPLPNAVCCSDYKHCCPQGTQCTTSGCSGGSGIMKMFSKISSRKTKF